MSERCADECLFHWPAVQKAAEGRWETGFAAEVAERARKPWWRPTAKQLTIMRRMVDELFYDAAAAVVEAYQEPRGIDAVRDLLSRPETVTLPPDLQRRIAGGQPTPA